MICSVIFALGFRLTLSSAIITDITYMALALSNQRSDMQTSFAGDIILNHIILVGLLVMAHTLDRQMRGTFVFIYETGIENTELRQQLRSLEQEDEFVGDTPQFQTPIEMVLHKLANLSSARRSSRGLCAWSGRRRRATYRPSTST